MATAQQTATPHPGNGLDTNGAKRATEQARVQRKAAEEAETARAVRLTLSAFKVSVIAGADMWSCFPPQTHELIRGLSQHLVRGAQTGRRDVGRRIKRENHQSRRAAPRRCFAARSA